MQDMHSEGEVPCAAKPADAAFHQLVHRIAQGPQVVVGEDVSEGEIRKLQGEFHATASADLSAGEVLMCKIRNSIIIYLLINIYIYSFVYVCVFTSSFSSLKDV